ncbi:hypothetical protein TNCV_2552391 [Trichonephila clavipes]|nr:hypothetical protein TNCV_2552391 [Trichonephila clavipes]
MENIGETSMTHMYNPQMSPAAGWCTGKFHSVLVSQYFSTVGDRLMNTLTKDFCVRITNTFKKDFLCLDNEHILGGDEGDTPEIIEGILTTDRDLELEVNEHDIEEIIMGNEDELTTELQEILNEEHHETQRNVSPSEQEEEER